MSTQEPLTYEGRHGPRSLGRGSIVNMGSLSSFIGGPGRMAYTTSKHALIGMAKVAGKFKTQSHQFIHGKRKGRLC